MFETINKVCVWGCGVSRQSESISISKNKACPLLLKGLTGAHLDITIVFTITVNVWEQKQSLCGGMVLADSQKVFPVVKTKPLLPPPVSITKGLSGAHLYITIDFTVTDNVWKHN